MHGIRRYNCLDRAPKLTTNCTRKPAPLLDRYRQRFEALRNRSISLKRLPNDNRQRVNRFAVQTDDRSHGMQLNERSIEDRKIGIGTGPTYAGLRYISIVFVEIVWHQASHERRQIVERLCPQRLPTAQPPNGVTVLAVRGAVALPRTARYEVHLDGR